MFSDARNINIKVTNDMIKKRMGAVVDLWLDMREKLKKKMEMERVHFYFGTFVRLNVSWKL